jgi:short-subunit dehydrogenase involved in D-alanine esterification of teichoic acids
LIFDWLYIHASALGTPSSGMKPHENTEEQLLNTLNVNTIAPDNIIRKLYPKISQQPDACIVYISSLLGQIADNGSGRNHPYRISKAASNALIWNWCIELMNNWKENHIGQLVMLIRIVPVPFLASRERMLLTL